jgi:hypothetical protein
LGMFASVAMLTLLAVASVITLSASAAQIIFISMVLLSFSKSYIHNIIMLFTHSNVLRLVGPSLG